VKGERKKDRKKKMYVGEGNFVSIALFFWGVQGGGREET
jgi:hypothetical protein